MRLLLLAIVACCCSCASRPSLSVTLGRVLEWEPNDSFKAKVEFELQDESYTFRLNTTRRLIPIDLDVEGVLILEDGTELKGRPKRVTPEFGNLGTFTGVIEVSFPREPYARFSSLESKGCRRHFELS
jgi:hypothetical protein